MANMHEGMARYILEASRALGVAWDPERTAAVDFGCAAGRTAQALVAHTRELVGLDVDAAAVAEFNRRAAEHGLEPAEMRAHALDVLAPGALAAGPGAGLRGRFDVATATASLHHVRDLRGAVAQLAALLRPGGTLFAVELDHGAFAHLSDGALAAHGVEHPSLTAAELADAAAAAGLENVRVHAPRRVTQWAAEAALAGIPQDRRTGATRVHHGVAQAAVRAKVFLVTAQKPLPVAPAEPAADAAGAGV